MQEEKDKEGHMERLDKMSIEQRVRRLEGIVYFEQSRNKKRYNEERETGE